MLNNLASISQKLYLELLGTWTSTFAPPFSQSLEAGALPQCPLSHQPHAPGMPKVSKWSHRSVNICEKKVNCLDFVEAYISLSLLHRNRLVLLHAGFLNLSLKQESFNPSHSKPSRRYMPVAETRISGWGRGIRRPWVCWWTRQQLSQSHPVCWPMRDKQPQCQPIGIEHGLCRPITEKRGRSCPWMQCLIGIKVLIRNTLPSRDPRDYKQCFFAAQKFITIKTLPKLQDI